MPQECLNFCVNSLVCIFFILLVGTLIDKAHDLGFPWVSLGGCKGSLSCWWIPSAPSSPSNSPSQPFQPFSSLALFITNVKKERALLLITGYSLENATRFWFWIFMRQDSENRRRAQRGCCLWWPVYPSPTRLGRDHSAFDFRMTAHDPSSNIACHS